MSPRLAHTSESHEIFDRVTTLEATTAALHESVKTLAATVGETNASVSKIESMLSGVGKTDGKTIVTVGASVVGAMVVVASLFLGPVQRDITYTDKQLVELTRRYDEHLREHTGAMVRTAEVDGELKLLGWRLGALEEEKKP